MTTCSNCNRKAVYNSRCENKDYCKDHFCSYVEKRVLDTISRHNMIEKGDKVAVAVSGGKDSSLMLYVLSKISNERKKNDLIAITIDQGIQEFRPFGIKVSIKQCKELGIPLYALAFKNEYGTTLDEISKIAKNKTCIYCAELRRYLLNLAVKELEATKLSIGYTLDNMFLIILNSIMRSDFYKLSYFTAPRHPTDSMIAYFPSKYPIQISPLRELQENEIVLYNKIKDIKTVQCHCISKKGCNSGCPYPKKNEEGSHGWWRNVVTRAMNVFDESVPDIKYRTLYNYEKNYLTLFDKSISEEKNISVKCALCNNNISGTRAFTTVACDNCLEKVKAFHPEKIKNISKLN